LNFWFEVVWFFIKQYNFLYERFFYDMIFSLDLLLVFLYFEKNSFTILNGIAAKGSISGLAAGDVFCDFYMINIGGY